MLYSDRSHLYGCEMWPLKVTEAHTLNTFEHRCLRIVHQIRSSANDMIRSTTSKLSFAATACPGSAMFAEDRPKLLQIKAYAANQHLIGGNDMEDKSKLGLTPSNLTSSQLAVS